jgi:nucleotide-binding universal stress UspA family protein
MYQRILVATGGSLWSDAALTYAIALAAHTGAELRVLTVLASLGMYATPDGMDEAALVVDIVERDGQALLADAAVEERADLIVLGSRGVSGRKRLMLGSISNAVATKALQPVLIVKRFLDT